MNKKYDGGDLFAAGFFSCLAVALVIGIGVGIHHKGYRDGQIDALTGTVEYSLVANPDGTSRWLPIERTR